MPICSGSQSSYTCRHAFADKNSFIQKCFYWRTSVCADRFFVEVYPPSLKDCADEAVNQLTNKSTNQQTRQSTIQPIDQPTIHPINQPINQTTKPIN